jgi:hypothetical protein
VDSKPEARFKVENFIDWQRVSMLNVKNKRLVYAEFNPQLEVGWFYSVAETKMERYGVRAAHGVIVQPATLEILSNEVKIAWEKYVNEDDDNYKPQTKDSK